MTAPSYGTIIDVQVTNFAFTPISFDVAIGDTIRWTLVEGTHTTTSTSIPVGATPWDYTFSGVGDTFDYVVMVAGVYEYYCVFHPSNMIASFSTSVALPLTEDFDYTDADLLVYHGWVAHSGGGTNSITVTTPGLTFPGYPSSGIGNAALLDNTGEDIHRQFDPVADGPVYASAMINVSNSGGTAAGYFMHFGTNPRTFNYSARVFVQDNGANVAFGLSFASGGEIYTNYDYNYGETYLLVAKYEVVAAADDSVALYVFASSNPPTTTEPSVATLGPYAAAGNTEILPGEIDLRQYSSNQSLVVDGLRVSTSWSGIVPVELTSFTASTNGNSVTLNWTTATELNNSGFEIQRSSEGENWQNLAFVNGIGTSTETHSYSYTDNEVEEGSYSYRLKQIDFDGSFEYSNIINISVTKQFEYKLSQNYPNPFNPASTISFSIPSSSLVELKVFNSIGQEVAVLVNQVKDAGSYQIVFNASSLPSGVYFYKLTAGNFTETKRMLLLK